MTHIQRGILLKLAATLSATGMFACVRGLNGAIPTGEVVFFRSIFALLPLLIIYGAQGQLQRAIQTKSVWRHFGRGLSGAGGMFFNYLALAYLPLVQQTAFSYATPLFTVIFAAILLREVVRIYRWSAVVVGLGGVMVMLLPALSSSAATSSAADANFAMGAAAALAAAACAALSIIQIRKMTGSEDPAAIVFWFAVLTTLIGASTIVFGWKMPDLEQALLLVGCGLFGGLTQFLITVSLRVAPASLLAPFEYTTMLWSVLLGYVLFTTVPDLYTLVGTGIVVLAGLFTIWREQRLKQSAQL